MLLYEINAALAALLDDVDEETGELKCSPEDLDRLMMDRQDALEGIALRIKDLRAEADDIRAEEKTLAERRHRKENHAERLQAFLMDMLAGERLDTPRVEIRYRKSESVQIDPEGFFAWGDANLWCKPQPLVPDRDAIKRAIKQEGRIFPGVTLKQNNNMIIK